MAASILTPAQGGKASRPPGLSWLPVQGTPRSHRHMRHGPDDLGVGNACFAVCSSFGRHDGRIALAELPMCAYARFQSRLPYHMPRITSAGRPLSALSRDPCGKRRVSGRFEAFGEAIPAEGHPKWMSLRFEDRAGKAISDGARGPRTDLQCLDPVGDIGSWRRSLANTASFSGVRRTPGEINMATFGWPSDRPPPLYKMPSKYLDPPRRAERCILFPRMVRESVQCAWWW